MTAAQSVFAFVFGLLCVVVGLTWALGPWALFVCGFVVTVAALLLPLRAPSKPDEPQL